MTDNTPDTQLEEITETGTPNIPDHTATPYTPVFHDTVRTVIYVVTLVASVIGLGFMSFGSPEIGGFISTAAGIIAAGFGVAYNPVRMAGKSSQRERINTTAPPPAATLDGGAIFAYLQVVEYNPYRGAP